VQYGRLSGARLADEGDSIGNLGDAPVDIV
jgi:hypothetical protein